jgi:hypothetical protein
MVSFSCEVCLRFPSPSRAQLPDWIPAPGDALHYCRMMAADCELLRAELWGCPYQEEARRPSQPVLWRVVYLLGLHDPLRGRQLQSPHGMLPFPTAAFRRRHRHSRAVQTRRPSHPSAIWLTLARRASPKTKSTKASCTARRRSRSTRRKTAPSRIRKPSCPALPTSRMRPTQRTAQSPLSMPRRAPLPLRPP